MMRLCGESIFSHYIANLILENNFMTTKNVKVGLALGSGASRGWAHIGVLEALAEMGVKPDIVCGTSIGSLVGAAYLSNNVSKLKDWLLSLSKYETARFFEINRSLNGFVNKERLHDFLHEYVALDDARINQFAKQYGAVATDLETGREIWLTDGLVLEAVWASISLPGLFPAIRHEDKWLIDGGLVNPVPVSLCRALGADIVIAVNLNGDIVGKHFKNKKKEPRPKSGNSTGAVGKLTELITEYAAPIFPAIENGNAKEQVPSLFDAIASSINITQDRITRSRMAGDPPDILLSPRLSQIGLLEFYRAAETIEEGRRSVARVAAEVEYMLQH
jgi:NTE family protein